MGASVAQSTTDFERLIGSMRERLRPTRARLFAEWLRTYVGLNCAGVDENHLLKMLLQEVTSPQVSPAINDDTGAPQLQ